MIYSLGVQVVHRPVLLIFNISPLHAKTKSPKSNGLILTLAMPCIMRANSSLKPDRDLLNTHFEGYKFTATSHTGSSHTSWELFPLNVKKNFQKCDL